MNTEQTLQVAIRIDRSYQPKNKLQEQIVKNLRPFHQTLWDYSFEFITEISKAVDLAHAQCSTRCRPEKLEKHERFDNSGCTYYVSGLIYIEMMYLKKVKAA